MGIFGSLFGKKAANVKQELAKVENRDLMEAIVAGSILVAYADGECEEEELAKMEQVISALPELSHFGSKPSAAFSPSLRPVSAWASSRS